jgi:hypothetical protein
VLSFVNGTGRPPKVKRLRLVEGQLLEATVDVSGKGPRRVRFFDVRVTLPDGRAFQLPEGLRVEP